MRGLEKDVVQLLVGGSAGSGSIVCGTMLARALMEMGYYIVGDNEYPSIIRGGHTAYWVRASVRRINEIDAFNDLVVAMDHETFIRHSMEFHSDTVFILDSKVVKPPDNAKVIDVPVLKLLREEGMELIVGNSIFFGAVAAAIGIPLDYVHKAIEAQFHGRRSVIEVNSRAAAIGYEYLAQVNIDYELPRLKPPRPWGPRVLLTGNEAIALGIVKAGVKVYASYPMTPASPILHYLVGISKDKDIAVLQVENEIAAAQIVAGAAWAGVRAATGTSGGGFSLMVETLSMAGMMELPIVIVLAMRPGPSTGMATMSAQQDLLFAIFSGHGEFPRVVVAPTDQYDAYMKVIEVFNLAEKYRVPAIILEDKHLAEGHRSVPALPEEVTIDRGAIVPHEEAVKLVRSGLEYKPYQITKTGVSLHIPPGVPGLITRTESSEHDEDGFVTIVPHKASEMYLKRLRKIMYLRKEIEEKYKPLEVHGVKPSEADLVIFTWGSTLQAVIDAMEVISKELSTSVINISYLWPFPRRKFREALIGAKNAITLSVEHNALGLLGKLIRMETGFKVAYHLGKVDGRPFRPSLLVERIAKLTKAARGAKHGGSH